MKRTGSSAKEIADEMISNGVSVQEITIRGWLDEESHTVRPQKLDSIQQIALIAGNDELFDGAESVLMLADKYISFVSNFKSNRSGNFG